MVVQKVQFKLKMVLMILDSECNVCMIHSLEKNEAPSMTFLKFWYKYNITFLLV